MARKKKKDELELLVIGLGAAIILAALKVLARETAAHQVNKRRRQGEYIPYQEIN